MIINHAAMSVRPPYIKASKFFLRKRLPNAPAVIVPTILNSPMTPMASAPKAAVVVMPNLARILSGLMAAQASVTSAGKWAVTNAN